jgi:hypothetical protein
MVTDNLGPQGRRGFGTRGARGRLASGPTCQCEWPRGRLDRRLLGQGGEKRPKYSFLFFLFSFFIFAFKFKFQIQTIVNFKYTSTTPTCKQLFKFIYYYYYFYINYSIANVLYTHKELLNFQEIHSLPN